MYDDDCWKDIYSWKYDEKYKAIYNVKVIYKIKNLVKTFSTLFGIVKICIII